MTRARLNIRSRIEQFDAGWPGPFTADDVFGTHDPATITSEVEAFCRDQLGSPVEDCLFYEASVGCTFGLGLADGRKLVLRGGA